MRMVYESRDQSEQRRGTQLSNFRVILDTTVTVAADEKATVFVNIDCDNFNVDELIFCPYKDARAKKGQQIVQQK